MREFIKKFGVYIVAAAVFVAIACIYCAPQFQGKRVFAGDNISGESAVHECVQYTKDTGRHSWWTGSMFCGMPNYQIGGGKYKSSVLLSPLKKIAHKGHSNAAWVFIIYFFCFYIVLRSFEVDRFLSIAGAIAMGLSSYFIVIIAAGHNGKTSTIALMSVVLAGLYLLLKGKYGLGAVFCSLFTALGFSTHPQMAYYMFLLMGMVWLCYGVDAVRKKQLKAFGLATAIFVGSVGLGVGTGCSNVFANSEYAAETMRGGHSDLVKEGGEKSDGGLDIEYATQWSYGIDETMSFIIPAFKGGANSYPLGKDSDLYKKLVKKGVPARSAAEFCASAPMYWGDQPFTAGNVYMGAVVCLLFVLGLIVVQGPLKWALLIATVLSTMLAWGHNFMWLTELFFKYFPMYDKFRAVSSILIVAEIAMPLLGFVALKEMFSDRLSQKEKLKAIYTSAGITAGICLFFALAAPALFDFTASGDQQWKDQLSWLYPDILASREALLRSDALRSAIFILLGAAALYFAVKGKLPAIAFAVVLGVLVLADMWPVDKRYFNDSCFVPDSSTRQAFAMQPYEKELSQDKDPDFRVLNLTTNTFNDARTSYYNKSLGGYSAAKLRRYQDIIDRHLSKMNMKVINMLNAKYIITPDEQGKPAVYANPEAMGNAWFVDSVLAVADANAESDALNTEDLAKVAVVGPEFASEAAGEAAAQGQRSVKLLSYAPDRLEYSYSADSPSTLVFSEIYYPYGWKASIDGAPATHFRADYILRAMKVPAGEHNICFVFDPDSVRKGDAIAFVCIILMYLLILAVAGFNIQKKFVKFAR